LTTNELRRPRARSIASIRIAISGRLGSSRVKFGAGLTTTHLEYDDTIQICALDAIPYILVFDRNVVRIELRLLDRRAAYVRTETEQLDTGSQLTVIGGSSPRFKR